MPTTITKTIGVGKDYASIDAWVAGAASTYPSGLVAADVIWKGVLYKEGSGTNNEWVISSATTTYTLTCDATRYYLLEAASGQSFADNANKLTNALRYNNANGASISVSGNYVWLFDLGPNSRLTIRGLQIKLAYRETNTGNGRLSIDKCIIENTALSLGIVTKANYIVNSLLYTKASIGKIVGNYIFTDATLINCTFIGSGGNYAITLSNYSNTNNIIRNCSFFGFTTGVVDNVAKIDAANSTYNVTDLSTFGWAGAGNLVSKTFANQFENIGSGTEDFRVKTGADLISAGIRDQTFTNDLDIVGTARSTAAPPNGPTIGAWEYASITPPSTTDYSSPMSRGIFRGIERGVA